MKKKQTSLADFLTKKPKSDLASLELEENRKVSSQTTPKVERKVGDTRVSNECERSSRKFHASAIKNMFS